MHEGVPGLRHVPERASEFVPTQAGNPVRTLLSGEWTWSMLYLVTLDLVDLVHTNHTGRCLDQVTIVKQLN